MRDYKKILIIKFIILVTSFSLFGQVVNEDALHHDDESHKFCNLCKERLQAKLLYLNGITDLNIDFDKNNLHVQFREKQNSASDIWEVVREAGYKLNNVEENRDSLTGKLYPCVHKEKKLVSSSN